MKQLPNEKELIELVELARIAAEKAKVMSNTADAIATKWERRFEAKRVVKKQQET